MTADENAVPAVCSIPDAQIKVSESLVKELLKTEQTTEHTNYSPVSRQTSNDLSKNLELHF